MAVMAGVCGTKEEWKQVQDTLALSPSPYSPEKQGKTLAQISCGIPRWEHIFGISPTHLESNQSPII